MRAAGLPLIRARVMRSGFAESEHAAHAVFVDPDGRVVRAWGDARSPHFPRSCNKPMQAVGMVRAGLALTGADLAIVAASHNGEAQHIGRVGAILADAGLDLSDLANTPDLPYGAAAREAWLRAGNGPTRVAQNCSGKHAGMLLTAASLGVPTSGYLAEDHPVQQAASAGIWDLSGEHQTYHGIDGCGAPVVALSLVGLARGFSRMVRAPAGSAANAVAAAMSRNPEQVGGQGRDVTAFMLAVPGAIAKDGAEGVHALALPDGRALAVKVIDGADRARQAVVATLLGELDLGEVGEALAPKPVLGGGRPVGRVEVDIPR